jgi:hypothetical protein
MPTSTDKGTALTVEPDRGIERLRVGDVLRLREKPEPWTVEELRVFTVRLRSE